MKYFIYGYLKKDNEIICTCVAGIDNNGGVYNMRGGLEYMKKVEEYPCIRKASIEAHQIEDALLYNHKQNNGIIFEACEPLAV